MYFPSEAVGFAAKSSLQLVAYWQLPCLHRLVLQSAPIVQLNPRLQGLQVPPQSTSVSAPFFTVSVQLAAVQSLAEQTPLVQSEAAVHTLVSGHLEQVPPPQSTSVSAPFFTVSVQEGAEQTLFMQAPLPQSDAATQAFLSTHLEQVPPPQSTSVSAPFLIPSAHVGVGVGMVSAGLLLHEATPTRSRPRMTW